MGSGNKLNLALLLKTDLILTLAKRQNTNPMPKLDIKKQTNLKKLKHLFAF